MTATSQHRTDDGVDTPGRRPAPRAAVQPERLLARAEHRLAPSNGIRTKLARRIVHKLLGRMDRDQLTIVDHCQPPGQVVTNRQRDVATNGDALSATINVFDERAWTALAFEGSIGLGRGYLEKWWDSDDPVAVVRIIIRNLERVDHIRNQVTNKTAWFADPIRAAMPKPTRSRNKEDIASHYDLGNDFFKIFLDETLTYSAAVFASPNVALAQASQFKYDRLLAKLGVSSEHSLLEIGTGWGGFAIRAAGTTGCQVTTTTISDEQLREAARRVNAAELDRSITLLDSDWRDLSGSYDRVASIEMIEAVDWRDYDSYFATIEGCLKPNGMAAIQAICVPDRRYLRTRNTEDFIRRFVFPGGYLPSLHAISASVSKSTQLQIVDVEDLTPHYVETLRRWRQRFDERIDEVHALGLDDRFCRLWRFYLAYCEAAFSERHCTVNQIVFAGPRWRPDGLSLRPA